MKLCAAYHFFHTFPSIPKKEKKVVTATKGSHIQETNVHFLQASAPPSGPGSKEETSCEGQVLGLDRIWNYI